MTNYIGLNVSFSLNDIADNEEALQNIGLDIRDLDIIRGIQAEGINSQELQLLSGLDQDQEKELYSLYFSSERIENLSQEISDIQVPLNFNQRINNQLRAGSIKYNFLDYSDNLIKTADISTSRVSSWSSLDNPATPTSDIFYGGQVEVVGSELSVSSLKTKNEPEPLKYPNAEVPTHLITIDVNGTPKQFYAMKGIPLQFEGFFRNARLSHKVSDTEGEPVWRIENIGEDIFYENQNIGNEGTYFFADTVSKKRLVQFYFRTDQIQELGLPSINLTEYPNIVLENLLSLDLKRNDLYVMPDFATLAPKLEKLDMKGNNLSRARDASGAQIVANTQLSNLPVKLKELYIPGCFSDSTQIDISYLENLEVFDMDTFYTDTKQRKMRDNGSTPKVNSSSIKNYKVTRHRYTQLDTSVTTSTTLEELNIRSNNITADSSGNTNITIASPNLKIFNSQSNSHQIINVSNKTNLTSYAHQFSRDLEGITLIDGVFAGCTALESIRLTSTDATGKINTNFANLPKLEKLDIRGTRMDGSLQDDSFEGTTSLREIFIKTSLYDTDDFFGKTTGNNEGKVFYNTPNLERLYVYDNSNIAGELPDFSRNEKLRNINIRNTSISGPIPLFSENISLSFVRLDNNKFESIPAFKGSNFRYIFVNGNEIDQELQEFECANLLRFSAGYNQILGTIPTFANCSRIEELRLENNSITQFSTGTIDACTKLKVLDLSNNSLSESSAINIISDLVENYKKNPRIGGVVVNLLGNANITEQFILSNEIAARQLSSLRNNAKWSINI